MGVFRTSSLFFFICFASISEITEGIAHLKSFPLNLRKGPSTEYPIISILNQDKIVQVSHIIDDWCMVDIYNIEMDGWVKCRGLRQGKEKKTIIKSDDFLYRLPIFNQPIFFLRKDMIVSVILCVKSSCKIGLKLKNSKIYGWCKKDLLWGF